MTQLPEATITAALRQNLTSIRASLSQENMPAILDPLTMEHRHLATELRQCLKNRNKALTDGLLALRAQTQQLISEMKRRLAETRDDLQTLENKKKLLGSYGVVTAEGMDKPRGLPGDPVPGENLLAQQRVAGPGHLHSLRVKHIQQGQTQSGGRQHR